MKRVSARKLRSQVARRRSFILAGSIAALTLCVAREASATSANWTGGGSDALWSNLANWSANPVPGVGDTATFNAAAGAGGAVITVGNISLGTLVFDTSNAAAYTIGPSVGTGTIVFADGTTNIVTMNAAVANDELINANLTLGTAIASTSTISNASTTNILTIAGNITGGTGGTAAAKTLTISGAGQTIISGAVTKGGATSLAINDTATGPLTLSGTNSILSLSATQTNAVVNLGTGTTTISNTGSTTVLFSNGGSINGGTIFLNAGTTGSSTLSGNYGDFGTTAGTLTVNSVIAGSSGIGVDFFPAAGTVVLTAANTFSGPADIYGTVSVSKIGNIGVAGNLGLGTVLGTNAGNISIGNGTAAVKLVYTGTGDVTNRTIALSGTTGGSTLDQSGTGLLYFTNTANMVSPSAGAKTITLQGSTAGVGRLDAGITTVSNGAAALSLTKAGTGTWIVGGTNSYTGATTISAGTLIALNHTAFGSTSAVTVAANAGLTYIAPSDTTLLLGSTLAFSGAATLGGTIGSTGTSAEIITTGNATSTAAALTVSVYGLNGVAPATGTYTLLHGGGAANTLNTFSSITLGKILNNTNWTITPATLAKTATDITVGVTSASVLTSAFWTGGLAGSTNVWAASDGTANSNWVTAAGGGATAVVPGAAADVTISATTPTLAPTATVLGANMTIKTLTIADTVNGLGLNADGFALTITPAASTAGITENASVPASTIAANLVLGAAQTWTNNSTNALTISGNVTGASTLGLAGTGPITVSGNLANSALITKSGTGALTLSGGNTFSAGLTVSGTGAVNINSPIALGAATSTFTIGAATSLDNTTGAAITLLNNNPVAINSSFTFTGGTGTTHDLSFGTSAVTVGTAPTITINNASTVTLGGTVAGGANLITKAGTGSLSLSGVMSGTVANGLNSVAVTGGTMAFTGTNNSFSGNITVDGASTVLSITGSNGSATGGPLGYVVGGTTTPAFKTVTLTNGGIFRTTANYNVNVPTAALPANGYVFVIGAGGGVFDVPSGVLFTVDDGVGAGTATTNSELQGSGALTKTGAGTLALGSGTTNTFAVFTGTITASAGLIQLGNFTAPLGATSAGTVIQSGAALNVNGTAQVSAEPLTLTGTGLAATPAGALTSSTGTGTWVGPITIGAGGATVGGGAGALIVNATIALGANTLTINGGNGSGRTTTGGVISGTGAVIVNGNGTADWADSIAHTYSGGTTLNANSLTVAGIGSVGVGAGVTSGPFGTSTLVLNGGGLRAGISGPYTIGNTTTLQADTLFYTVAGERSLILAGPMTITGATRTLTSTVGNTVAGAQVTISGAIGDGGGGFGLVKAGTGYLTLAGVNTYGNSTNGTAVNAGILTVTGSLANNTPLTVAGGATFSLQNNVANPLANITTLNLGTTALTTGLVFDLGTTSDSLNTASAATTAGTIAFNFNAIAGFGSSPTYTLLTAASGLSGATYTLGNSVPGGYTYTFTPTDTSVVLNLTAAAGGNLYWRGSVNNSWSTLSAGSTNWTTDIAGAAPVAVGYNPGVGNTVIFSSTGATGPAIGTTLDGNFTVNDLQFASVPSGVTSVAINNGNFGTNTLTIAPASSAAGILLAQGAGAVTIAAPLALGTAQTWSVDSSTPGAGTASSLTVSGPMSGSGAVTFTTTAGTTPIILSSASGTSVYTGGSTVSANTIVQGGGTNALSSGSAWTVNGTLNTGAFSQVTGSLVGGSGTVQDGTATSVTLSIGNDNLGTNATPVSFGGLIQNGSTGTLGITKVGTGVQELTGANTYTGATTVNAGTLRLSGTSAATTVTVNSGGTLQIGGGSALTSANGVTLAGTGILDLFGNSVTIGALTNAATNTITNSSAGAGASTATTSGSPALTDALTISPATAANIAALITDGPTRKTQIVLNNANAGITTLANTGNTFSGGLVLANNASGTRLDVTTVNNVYGTGPIIVGQATTDKAGVYFPSTIIFNNPIVSNTVRGTDVAGTVRVDAPVTFTKTLTANLAPFVFNSNGIVAATDASTVTGQITGPNAVYLDFTGTSAGTAMQVTLNNTANPANNYQGDTIINNAAVSAKSATLILGADNQIPNGAGTGNVIVNTNGTGVGTLNLNGKTDTINGLSGNGSVTGTGATLILGDNDATASFSGVTTGGSITKIGAGTQTFSGANTFTALNGNGGLVAFATAPATAGPLGNTTTVNLNGGGISYTATGTNPLNRTVAIGAAAGTLDVASSTGTLTMTSVTSTGGNLIKTGPGLALISGTTTLNAGNAGIVVNGGTLQAGFGSGGVKSITVGASGNLNLVNSVIESLTLGNGLGALTLNGGAQLGFELNALTNDSIAVGATGTALGSGAVTLNFFNFGSGVQATTYNLLTAPSGLSGATYTLGAAPNGFNYTINVSDTLVSLTTQAYTPIYWRGGQNLSWNTLGAAAANWTTDSGGTVDGHTPLPSETVIFSATGAPTVSNTITTTLDAAFTIDSLQFSNVPTSVTAVTINAGGGGALTVTPVSSSGGIKILAGAGNATIASPLTLGATQTWDVADSSSTLTISGNATFNAAVTKTGAGAVTLSGTNSGSSAFNLAAGRLNLNSVAALGTGTLGIAAGASLDNTSGVPVALSAATPVSVTGDFTFAGTSNLGFGAGPVTLVNNPTITVTASSLTFAGAVGGSSGLTKTGAGTLALSGNNTYSGLTTINGGVLTLSGNNTAAGGVTLTSGILNINSAGALGAGTFTVNGGTINNTSGSSVTSNAVALAFPGSFTFTGTNDLNLGSGTLALATTQQVTTTAGTLTLGGPITGGNLIGQTKAGAGTLVIAGAATYGGLTTVNAGTLSITGSLIHPLLNNIIVNGSGTLNVSGTITGNAGTTVLSYGPTAGKAIVNVTGGTTTLFATQGASLASAVSAYNQSGGTVTVSPGTGNSQYVVKNVANTYGYFGLTGGTYKNTGRFDVTAAANAGLTSVGAVFVGGTNALLDQTNAEWYINGYGLNSTTVAAGGTIDRTGATNNTGIVMDSTVSAGSYGVINIAGGTFTQTTSSVNTTAGKGFNFGNSSTAANQSGTTGYFNMAGGTLNLGGGFATFVPTAPAIINTGYMNFVGGSIKATATAPLVPASTSGINIIATTFGNTVTNGTLGATFSGGLNVNTNGFAITVANSIAGATGTGVTQSDMSVTSGSGYIGAPVVQFSTAGVVAGGTPAQGYAVLDGSGGVAGIVITDPGTYTAGTVPTVTLAGGGGTGASIAIGPLSTTNTQGGLTLTDSAPTASSNLILTAASTYTGTTTIGSGAKLSLGAAGTVGALSPSSAIVDNGNLTINRSNAVVQGTDFSSAPISGTGSLTVTAASTTVVTLNAANSYQGGTTLISTQGTAAGPILVVANSQALGSGTLTLRSSGFGGADTFQLSGTGLNISNPITMDTTLGFREGIDNVSASGANTLSGAITISGTTSQALILTNNSTTGTFTVSSNITATGGNASTLSLRGAATSVGTLSGVVTLNGAMDNNVGGTWTITPPTSGANTWTQTQMNSQVANTGLKLGITDALATAADVLWSTTGVGTIDLNGFNQTVAGIAATLTTPIITNTGSTDSILTISNIGTSPKTFTGVIQNGSTNSVGLTLNSTGKTQILTGANTYTGTTTITAGTLQLGSAGAIGTLSPSSAIVDNGTFTISRTNTVVQGTDFSSAAISGSGSLVLASTPTVTLTANNSYSGGTTIISGSTLNVGSGAAGGAFGTGAVANAGTLVFNRTDAYNLTASNLVTGAGPITLANTGSVVAAADNQFNTTGALNIGNSAGLTTLIGTLDLTNGSSSFGALSVLTNNAGNTITVGAGETLTNNGNVTIGYATPLVSAGTAKLTIGGGGTYSVTTAASGTFQVGGSTSATASLHSILDLTGLAAANINVSATGTVRVNQPSGANLAGNDATLLLPIPVVSNTTPVTTITAANLNAGDNGGNGNGAGQTNAITLGTGLTTLNVNTVNVGTGGRDFGQITFANANGNLILRAADGSSRAAVNIGTGTANTGVAPGTGVTNNVDFTGHNADLLIGTLAIGAQNRNTARTDTFAFDTGTLDVSGVVLATDLGTANPTVATGVVNTSNLNIGGGTATIGTGGIDIAFGQTAVTAASTHTLVGNFNVSGAAAVTVANNPTLGAAIRMSNNTISSGLTANSFVNVTGGSLTLAGDIIKGASTGAGTATLNLNGASALLDLSGGGTVHNIGSATAVINSFTFTDGTLQNIGIVYGGITLAGSGSRVFSETGSFAGEVRGVMAGSGIGLQKTGTGTVMLSGANTFSGNIDVNNGILVANRSNNSLNPASSALGNPQVARNINVNTGGTLRFDAGDTFGSNDTTVPSTLVINAGGLVTNSSFFTTLGPVQLNGGTLTGVGGAANLNFQMYSLQGAVTVGGSSASTISGPAAGGSTFGGYHLSANTSFNVADATGNAASDLEVSGVLIDRQNSLGAGGLTKSGAGTMRLSSASGYTGPTTITGGTLEISGSLSGVSTAAITVSGGGTLRLSGNNAINNTGMGLTLGDSGTGTSGTLMTSGATAISETLGTFTLDYDSTIDFSGAPTDLTFNSFGAHSFGGPKLTIFNWSGSAKTLGTSGVNDRLIFNGDATALINFTTSFDQSDISFGGVSGYQAKPFGANQFEVVAVPEPSSTALLAAAGIFGLLGYRSRFRSSGMTRR